MTETQAFRPTGVWPFSMFPESWSGRIPANRDVAVVKSTVFDPVALACSAGAKLIAAGWIGLDAMDEAFQWQIVDAKAEDVDALVHAWVDARRDKIADMFENRLHSYAAKSIDTLARDAMRQGIEAYRQGHFLAVVRTLMPEVERFGRMVTLQDGSKPKNQKQAVAAIQDYLGGIPVSHFAPIESFTTYNVVSEELFEACYTAADAANLGPGPNRHAELHGLRSYGDLVGATKMLGVADFLLCSVNAAEASHTS